jgi:hypothetical protein
MTNLSVHAALGWGFDHFFVGPGLPVLAVYGERAYRAALTAPGLHRFAKVGLPDECEGEDLRPLLAKLKSRAKYGDTLRNPHMQLSCARPAVSRRAPLCRRTAWSRCTRIFGTVTGHL